MRLTNKHKVLACLALCTAPSMLYAAATDVGGFLGIVGALLNSMVPALIGLALVIFLFGVVKYIQAGDKAEKRDEGRQFMLYGIIALFVMVSIWGLVNVLVTTFGLGTGAPSVPQF
ncbi:MAG: Uncharacterized protein Greene041614_1199 [Parcubacteria group bacterium Greene0416_14]|nr:MAG: Uncharacterized protein Greene041614_1199 [Parcubacteria group bacterium Greene0416_14]TSC99089.1 MAG: Uncharacterized protein Greene101415_1193 [Parcubacteria group bacterium Greene1014_15]TSD06976.1 MAG: Uncharacterized protein Greene07144_1051 [Parcubacteria group bacterium Greene0714_4]